MNSKPKNFPEALEELDSLSTSKAQELKAKLQSELAKLEERIAELKPQLDEAKNKVEEKVKENPWATIGIVGLIFFVLGVVFGSRSRD